MINEKEGMIVYERTKFPKLAKPLLIDRLIVILEKYRGKGIGNYVFPVYTEKTAYRWKLNHIRFYFYMLFPLLKKDIF